MRLAIVLAAALAALTASEAAVRAKEPISVVMDRAKIMRLGSPAGTVIVGNPGIADAMIQDRQTLIITGRMVGITNLLILDAKGNTLAEEMINVEKIQEGLVTVQRGANRSSYFCTPHCAAMLEVGDSPDRFNEALTQINQRNQLGAQHAGGSGAQ